MPITGSQRALMQARSGIARAGATRCGYYTPNVALTITGVVRHTSMVQDSLLISLAINDEPDTASFTMKPGSTLPTVGQSVVIGLGTIANPRFAGQVLRVRTRRRAGNLGRPFYDVECTDWMRLFDRQRITRVYSLVSATAIVFDVLDQYTDGFTGNGIQLALPSIELVCTNERPSSVLRRIVTLIGGGGFVITPDRDVRLWDSGGDVRPGAPTPPVALANTLTTLKAFTHTLDGSQQRTQVKVDGRSTPCPMVIAAGTDIATILTPSLPVLYGWIFDPAGGQAVIDNTLVVQYGGRVAALGPPAAVLSAVANPGDTTVAVVSNTSLNASGLMWATPDGENYFFFEVGSATLLQSIPASGYGSIQTVIPSGTPIYGVDALTDVIPLTGSGLVDFEIQRGAAVCVRVLQNESAEQAALAAIEGGDGIHAHVVSLPNVDYVSGYHAAVAELTAFADADGLLSLEWTTTDLNANPGVQQVIGFTGTDAFSATVTITHVDLTFPKQHYPPIRRCQGSNVNLPQLAAALAEVVSRV